MAWSGFYTQYVTTVSQNHILGMCYFIWKKNVLSPTKDANDAGKMIRGRSAV